MAAQSAVRLEHSRRRHRGPGFPDHQDLDCPARNGHDSPCPPRRRSRHSPRTLPAHMGPGGPAREHDSGGRVGGALLTRAIRPAFQSAAGGEDERRLATVRHPDAIPVVAPGPTQHAGGRATDERNASSGVRSADFAGAPATAEQVTVTRSSVNANVPRHPSATQTPFASKPQVLPSAQLPSPDWRTSTTPDDVSAMQMFRSPTAAPQSMVRCAEAPGVGAGCAHASAHANTIAATDAAARTRHARLAVHRETPCCMDSLPPSRPTIWNQRRSGAITADRLGRKSGAYVRSPGHSMAWRARQHPIVRAAYVVLPWTSARPKPLGSEGSTAHAADHPSGPARRCRPRAVRGESRNDRIY